MKNKGEIFCSNSEYVGAFSLFRSMAQAEILKDTL